MKTIIRVGHVPPSTNGLYANIRGKGRVKTERYCTWLSAAGWDMKRYHNQKWTEPVYLTIRLGKLRANADVSNRIKAIEDLLVLHEIIPGDSIEWVKSVTVTVSKVPFEGAEIIITSAQSEELAA